MKFLVISDTHGNYPLAIKALEQEGGIRQIIHLGDELADARIIEEITDTQVLKVAGNCDLTSSELREITTTFGRKRFFITHGDKYNVKAGLTQLKRKAVEEKAQIVLYGHTHLASIEIIDGILYVNPGSLNQASSSTSYATICIKNNRVAAEIVPFPAPLSA